MNKPVVHYERDIQHDRKYVMTSCLKKRLNGVDPPYAVTSDTNKVTCPECKLGGRYLDDRKRYILYGE